MKPLTGDFIGGNNGKWEGDVAFQHSLGAYEFGFTSLKADKEVFAAELMKLHDNELTKMGAMQETFGLHYNLLIWMHFSAYFTVGDKKQSFGFTAEPGDVFNREYFYIELGNSNNFCYAQSQLDFEPTYGIATTKFNYDEYIDSGCGDVANPYTLGYNSNYDGKTFSLHMDLVAMTSAMSVNIGILRDEHLQNIGNPFDVGPYNDKYVYLQRFYDPRFPRMDSLFCFDLGDSPAADLFDDDFVDDDMMDDMMYAPSYGPSYSYGSYGYGPSAAPAGDDFFSGDDFFVQGGRSSAEANTDPSEQFVGKCVLRLAEHAMIPVLFPYYEGCQSCPANLTNATDYCNIFDMVVGYVHFEENNMDEVIALLNKYPKYQDLNDAAFEAYNTYDFSFCDDKCSLLVVNAYDDIDQFISPDFYTLAKGFCTDSTKKGSMISLGNNTPTELVEEYYRCKNSRSTSFFKSVGLANSNMLLFTPLVFIFFLTPFITAYHKYVVKEAVDAGEFDDDVRGKAVKVLVSELLRMAQNRESRFPDPDRVIVQLAQELNSIGMQGESGEGKADAGPL